MGRAPCCEKDGVKKGPWTPEEDEKLIDYIHKHGHGSWRTLPKNAGLARCGKSCRLRWTNYLRPDIKRGRFSFEEEEAIIQLHTILGNKWSAIAARLPGRTDNEIKNYWNTHIRKRLLRMGIDPVTHTPRLDLLASTLLALDPLLLNSDLFSLATTLLISTQPQRHSPFPIFQPHNNHLQNAVQACTTSHLVNQAHTMQANDVEQFQSETILQANEWQLDCHFSTNNLHMPSTHMYHLAYQNFDQSLHHNIFSDNMINFDESTYDHKSINILDPILSTHFNSSSNYNPAASVFSTPTPGSSPTRFNSSSAYVTEDERDSYCSDLLKFQVPDLLDVNDFM